MKDKNINDEKVDETNAKINQDGRFVRYILDPFQIFCLERRLILRKQFPEKKIYEITSMLSQIWRGLSEDQKKYYHNMASKLKNNRFRIRRRRKKKEGNVDPAEEENDRKESNDTDAKETKSQISKLQSKSLFEDDTLSIGESEELIFKNIF